MEVQEAETDFRDRLPRTDSDGLAIDGTGTRRA